VHEIQYSGFIYVILKVSETDPFHIPVLHAYIHIEVNIF
jgi:hypothetical protein